MDPNNIEKAYRLQRLIEKLEVLASGENLFLNDRGSKVNCLEKDEGISIKNDEGGTYECKVEFVIKDTQVMSAFKKTIMEVAADFKLQLKNIL